MSTIPLHLSEGLQKDTDHLTSKLRGEKASLLSRLSVLGWRSVMNLSSRFYIKIDVIGSWEEVYQRHERLLIISNHSSHLDAITISGSMPLRMWNRLFIAVARDYFFARPVMTAFSKNCLNAIPFDRDKESMDSMSFCMHLLKSMSRIWVIVFPEGTRSVNGEIGKFKKGVSLMARRSDTPLLFVYMQGGAELWPKGHWIPRPGRLKLYIGPVQEPAAGHVIESNYRNWVESITGKPTTGNNEKDLKV